MDLGIVDFFAGRDVLITGVTGFMGKVLVEKLLRSCPQIGSIYVLIRGKKGKSKEERLLDCFTKPLFDKLKEEQPNALKKVIPVEGDVSHLNLGLSENDRNLLTENISVVFHLAASVRFDDSLKYAILMNVRGTREIANLCLKMKKIKVFSFVSTAYSNCEQTCVEEKLYPPYLDWSKAIDIAEKGEEYITEILTNKCLGKLPNTYVFSKSLAENVVNDLCEGLIPIVIFRPSIVTATHIEPIRGWVEGFNGPVSICIGVMKGLIRTVLMDLKHEHDFIACDISSKALIISTWLKSKEDVRSKVFVCNCCTTGISNLRYTNKFLLDSVYLACYQEKLFWYPSCVMTSNYYLYFVLTILFHFLPAVIADCILKIRSRKPFFLKTYKKIFIGLSALSYFGLHKFNFENKNFVKLDNCLLSKDRADWSLNLHDVDKNEQINSNCIGYLKYLLKEDIMPLEEGKKRMRRLYWLDRITKVIVVVLIIWWLLKRYAFYGC